MVQIDWNLVWAALGDALGAHHGAGRRHLLTEDVVRFATVVALTEQGVGAERLAMEQPIAGVGRVDLLLDQPDGAAIEFKFPREPDPANAADAMTFGEILRDFYRLARLGVADAWVVQILQPRLRQYLVTQPKVSWTYTPGETIVLPGGLRDELLKSTRDAIPEWATEEVRALCCAAHSIDDDLLVVYRIS